MPKPIFTKPAGESKRLWNNLHSGTDGGAVCGLCGTEWGEGVDLIRGRFLDFEIIEECCGRVFDIIYQQLGEEIVREYLKDFSENPTDPRFYPLLNYYLPEAIQKAREKAEDFLRKSNAQEDLMKIQEACKRK
jgi:hypothetical protein